MDMPLNVLFLTGTADQADVLMPAIAGLLPGSKCTHIAAENQEALFTVQQLQAYDAVFTYTDAGYKHKELSDVFADFLDEGGALLTAPFCTNDDDSYGIRGRYHSDQYFPMQPGGQMSSSMHFGPYHMPLHPLLRNVGTEAGPVAHCYHSRCSVAAGAVLVASFRSFTTDQPETEMPYVAYREICGRPTQKPGVRGCVVTVNLHPSYIITRDYMQDVIMQVFANGLSFAVGVATNPACKRRKNQLP
eukprot:TRINITY_DN7167_c0_g1_i3.p1 TRINITY_DN7167_c0_g1~~TRINITY_DN7167_c0_g1_i3.p1  ORF type:complete len:246 (-),score=37.93 TRINITY_DN7167_c0_g1_i3:46-783(-)